MACHVVPSASLRPVEALGLGHSIDQYQKRVTSTSSLPLPHKRRVPELPASKLAAAPPRSALVVHCVPSSCATRLARIHKGKTSVSVGTAQCNFSVAPEDASGAYVSPLEHERWASERDAVCPEQTPRDSPLQGPIAETAKLMRGLGRACFALAAAAALNVHPALAADLSLAFNPQAAQQLLRERAELAVAVPHLATAPALSEVESNPFPQEQRQLFGTFAAAATDEEQSTGLSLTSQILRGLRIGEADVYYPRQFLGTWECESILLSVDTPQGGDVADIRAIEEAKRRIGAPVVYTATFIQNGENVIADRLATTTSLIESTVGKGVVEDAEWSPSKPNVLNLMLRGGLKLQNLITKRSFELSAPGQFDVSEYSKQVLDNQRTVEGPPSVKASGNLTRFRWDPDASRVNEVEAFQRVAMYPVVGGAAGGRGEAGLTTLDVVSLGFGEKPTTVYKYLLHMKRVD